MCHWDGRDARFSDMEYSRGGAIRGDVTVASSLQPPGPARMGSVQVVEVTGLSRVAGSVQGDRWIDGLTTCRRREGCAR